jgi:D-alanyl-D-alanine carboxypeptidase (penicillin-binding protein 5/6)
MMIQSANDAAHALARAAAGSPEAFVELMNAKARELGLTHTTFRTPHGLPARSRRPDEGDLATPRDFAVLCGWLLRSTDVTKYTSVRTRPFGAGQRAAPVVMTNHNHLLGKVGGLDGLKTGYTSGASFSPDSKTRDLKVAELLERGFAALPATVVVKTGPVPPSSAPAAHAGSMPTVKTDRTPASEPSSTAKEPAVTFRVIPPGKTP